MDGIEAEVEAADGELASCWTELVSIVFCPYISYCVGKPCVGRQRVIETNNSRQTVQLSSVLVSLPGPHWL